MTRARQIQAAAALYSMILAHPADAQSAGARLTGQVVEFGETMADSQTPAILTQEDDGVSPRTEIIGIRFVNHDDALTAQLCLRFGVMIRLLPGRGERLPQTLVVRISHPRLTRPDQVAGTDERFPTPVIGDRAYAGWTFDQAWEIEPGDWSVTFLSAGQVLASKTFKVTAAVPPGSICPFIPVS